MAYANKQRELKRIGFSWKTGSVRLSVGQVRCPTGKMALPNHAAALKAIAKMTKRDKTAKSAKGDEAFVLSPYVCQQCHHWHIGHALRTSVDRAKEGPR